MQARGRAQKALTYVLFLIVVVVSAQFVLESSFGGSPVYVVVSSSMVPTLKIGDLVVVQQVPFSSIHVGDVIVYVTPTLTGACEGIVVVHRIVGVAADGGLITQGDNRLSNPTPDEPYFWPYVHSNCVRGKVVLAVPYLGLISQLFPPPLNYVVVAIILLFVFLTEFRGGRRDEAPETNPPGEAPTILLRHRGIWKGASLRVISSLA